jgi:hypothetical protein
MASYSFQISGSGDFASSLELPDDEAAWREALRTVKDVEYALPSAGAAWSLTVHRESVPIYRIDVRTERLS